MIYGKNNIVFGVNPSLSAERVSLPDDVVFCKVVIRPDDFAHAFVIRRKGSTLITEKWYLGISEEDATVMILSILAESNGKYNDEWAEIVRAGHLQTIMRGDLPVDERVLMFWHGRWGIGILDSGLSLGYLVLTFEQVRQCRIYDRAEIEYLPWVRLPEPIQQEENKTNKQ